MTSALVWAGAGVAGVLFVAVVYFSFVARSLRKAANKLRYQQVQNESGAPKRTLAEEDALLEAQEREQKRHSAHVPKTRWGESPDEPVDLFDVMLQSGKAAEMEEPRVLEVDNEQRHVFSNPLFGSEPEPAPQSPRGNMVPQTPASNRRTPGTPRSTKSGRTPLLSRRNKKEPQSKPYPGSTVLPAQGAGTSWAEPLSNYKPVPYTSPEVASFPPWADPGIITVLRGALKFNSVDTTMTPPVNRTSHLGMYQIVEGLPRNPVARTGIAGRGLLGRWGPNHAGDAIVTRWAFDPTGEPVYRAGKRVMEVVTITREDCGEIAFPGGFAENGESVPETIRREFGEEALASLDATPSEKRDIQRCLDQVFQHGQEIYKGYVNDPRNTDNAWIETVAINYHDEEGNSLVHFALAAGDDASGVHWSMVGKETAMYADHAQWLEMVARKHNAFWADGMFDATVQLPMKEKTMQVSNVMYESPPIGAVSSGAVFTAGRPVSVLEEDDRMSLNPRSPVASTFLDNVSLGGSSRPVSRIPSGGGAVYAEPSEIRRKKSSSADTAAPELPPKLRETSLHGKTAPSSEAVSDALGERKSSKAQHDLKPPTQAEPAPAASTPAAATAATTEPDLPEGHVASYPAKYYGGVSTTNPGGNDVVSACVKALQMDKAKIKGAPEINLVITADGIKAVNPVDRPKPADIILHVPIRQISFTGADTANKKLFAFIANDPKTSSMLCHVFECSTIKARVAVDAVKRAFALAQQLRTDPFAIKRDGKPTPEVAATFNSHALLDRATLRGKMVIGHGQYGKVYLADLKSWTSPTQKVAVKLMRPDVSHADAQEFLLEARMMAEFEHKNLLKFVGICLDKKPWLLVVEFMQYKDLGIVLRQCKKHKMWIRMHEMLYFASQVIEGLLYLGQNRYVHRDLAARNVLLHHDNQVKIGDFGLTRKIPDGQDYWRLDKPGRLPVKYMSVETLTLKRFSIKSDVWAFGVLWWELLSYAETPFQAEKIENVKIREELVKGTRLSKPKFQPADDYDHDPEGAAHAQAVWDRSFMFLSQETWHKEPSDRPSFEKLKEQVNEMLQDENKRNPPKRDIGLMCYEALEANRSMKRKIGERGGSIIRAAGTLERPEKGKHKNKPSKRGSSFRGRASDINDPDE